MSLSAECLRRQWVEKNDVILLPLDFPDTTDRACKTKFTKSQVRLLFTDPQWGTAEITDPSAVNPELKDSSYKAWSMSEYSHACFTYCQGSLPWTNFYLPGSFTFIFSKPLPSFPVLAVAIAGSCVGPQNEIGHSARCQGRLMNGSRAECSRYMYRL